MKLSVLAVLLSFLFLDGFSQSGRFVKSVEEFLCLPEYSSATTGIHVVDLESGHDLYALNANKLMIPASTLKLITSAAAIELLGSDYRFKTQVGYTGRIDDKILYGDLAVIGGGDPALGSEYFQEHYFNPDFLEVWTEKISTEGIEEVRGDLVLDVSFYDSEKNPPTWIWEDMGNYYGAGVSALTAFDNLFRITFRSPRTAGSPTEIISIQPLMEELTFKNEVLSDDIKYDMAYVFGSPLDNNRVLRGRIPKNRKTFTIKASVPKPELLLGKKILQALINKGITVTGDLKVKQVRKEDFKPVYIQHSPPLSEITEVLNHESVNLFAEHLVKQIAAEVRGNVSRNTGIELIKDFWEMNGIRKDNWFMEDGSGLSHFNAVPPKLFTEVLSYMYKKSSHKKEFVNSLATTGEGTLIYWDRERFSGGTLKVKSGSMTRVRCYAGYLELNSGRTIAFSIMVNHFSGGHAALIREIEELLYVLKSSF